MSKDAQQVWDYPRPFVIEHISTADEIDGYGHINNSVYVQWMDRCVWQHCESVGLSFDVCQKIGKGFAAIRHEIDYLRAAYENEKVLIANWVTLNDNKLRAERRFQIIRVDGWLTLLRARSKYVCTDLKTGRPCRTPNEFKSGFGVLDEVAASLNDLD